MPTSIAMSLLGVAAALDPYSHQYPANSSLNKRRRKRKKNPAKTFGKNKRRKRR